ncbi:hypothetical protein FHG87_022447 [Trinorchestia longiramus]|nr:hypothetical protein FHG87_022447 [Trinorchestia longiramus]
MIDRRLIHSSNSGYSVHLNTTNQTSFATKALHLSSASQLCISALHLSFASQLCITALHHSSASQLCITALHHSSASQLCITALHHSSASQLYTSTPHRCDISVFYAPAKDVSKAAVSSAGSLPAFHAVLGGTQGNVFHTTQTSSTLFIFKALITTPEFPEPSSYCPIPCGLFSPCSVDIGRSFRGVVPKFELVQHK